ncbi:TonB-dependent receptor [Emticicia fontis]
MKIPLFLLLLTPYYLLAQNVSIKGQIKGVSGEPVSYVSVSLKSTNKAVLSDSSGRFEIKGIAKGEYVLIASSIGFQTVEKSIKVNGTSLFEEFVMKSTDTELQEVVVTQERQSRVQETKPIAIKSIEIKNVISQNVLLTDVIDRVSGVRIRRSSSLGDRSDISINGLRGDAIRVYIDGIPMELLYPNFDISTLPIGNVKRLDIYKGVLPVDVGTDALGGGINIITEQKSHNSLRASYNVGSFNTHLADINLGLTNKQNYFLNLSAAYNHSDNDYKMKALLYENNKIEEVRRFHDKFQFFYGGITAGVHSKSWADELRLTLNYSKGYKQLQNGARISHIPFGEVEYHAENIATTLKYDKSFLNEKVIFRTIGNFSDQLLNYRDTTSNVYSWSGKIVGRNTPGEYTADQLTDNYSRSLINRSSLIVQLAPNHKLLASNLYAYQRLKGTDHLEKDIEKDYLRIPQSLTKNISGVQYEGIYFSHFTFSTAIKRFDFILNGAENNTFAMVKKKDGFWGWNVGLKYDIKDNLFARVSYEKGYLIPQFFQFVGNGADILRNTNLMPESSNNLNAGISYLDKSDHILTLSSTINGFYRRQNDIIFLGSGVARVYENADQVRTLGVEGEATVRYNKAFSLSTNITFMRKNFTAVKDPRNQYLVGAAFPNNPNFFGNVEFAWQKNSFGIKNSLFRAYAFYNYVAPFNHILIGKNNSIKTTPDSFVPVQHRLDIGCSYKFPKQNLTASINVLNVLNADLYDNFLVPRAGTNFNVKLIYELTKF